MDAKLQVQLLAALVPVVFGLIWYNPYLLGKVWEMCGVPTVKMGTGKLALTVVLTYIAGYYIASHVLGSIVIHQRGIYSMLAGNPDMHDKSSALYNTVQGLMDKYGTNYRTFKHGAYHGFFTGLYLVLPILLVTGLIESKRVCSVLVHAAFWTACLAVMGGIICQYMP
jgi:hypothetical protein